MERDVELVLVAAVAENGVIGADGDMPWHIPEDLRHFKRTTLGHPVVMGRVTYESIESRLGGPLPGRTNVVLTTRDLDVPEGVVLAGSTEEARAAARDAAIGDDARDDGTTVGESGADDPSEPPIAFVIGGASVYAQLLDDVDRIVLTSVEGEYEGDTSFPEWDRDEWHEVGRDDRDGFAFVEYVRASAVDRHTRFVT